MTFETTSSFFCTFNRILLISSIEIYPLPVKSGSENCIRKITVFQSKEYSEFNQKLTPIPYSCLSYNHYNIPDFSINNEVLVPGHRLQVTGPKIRDDIFAIHRGKLSQVLIEFTATGFYCFFNQSPGYFLNKIYPLEWFKLAGNIQQLNIDLASVDNPSQHSEILQKFIASTGNKNRNKYSYIESAIAHIEKSNGNITVESICSQTNISERQLNRKIIAQPTKYCKF